MTSIHDLAKCILLDDVNDVFYRSLCFSTYARSEYDAKTAMETKLDVMLDQRLARQLNWSSSICSLDTATHKFSHLLESLINQQLSQKSLTAMIEDNYWLKSAIEIELGHEVFAEAVKQNNLIDHIKTPLINKRIASIGWRYFASQMSEHNQYLLQQVIEFSDSVAQKTLQNSIEENARVEEDMTYHLAFINSYSFIVLLKLFDKAVQSIKFEALNTTAFECDQQRQLINQYLPTAESLLSLMTFDEFLKPHVFDNLNLVKDTYTNLLNGTEILDVKSKLFIKSRGQIIVGRLNKTSVLTAKQLSDFSSQIGMKVELNQEDPELGKSAKLWAKLLTGMPTLTPIS